MILSALVTFVEQGEGGNKGREMGGDIQQAVIEPGVKLMIAV